MTRGISEESFIREFSESLKNGNASSFIGSGISRKAQYVGWKDVLRECAIDIGLDVGQENDLITLDSAVLFTPFSRTLHHKQRKCKRVGKQGHRCAHYGHF